MLTILKKRQQFQRIQTGFILKTSSTNMQSEPMGSPLLIIRSTFKMAIFSLFLPTELQTKQIGISLQFTPPCRHCPLISHCHRAITNSCDSEISLRPRPQQFATYQGSLSTCSILINMSSFTWQRGLSLWFTWTSRLCFFRTRCRRDYTVNVDDDFASWTM